MFTVPLLPANARAEILAVYRYWDQVRGGRTMPSRRDIDPLELRAALGHVSILAVDAGSFRYRLFGSHVARLLGQELTGKSIDALPVAPLREEVRRGATHVAATANPVFVVAGAGRRESPVSFQNLLLPLSSDGKSVDALLVTTLASDPQIRSAQDWRLPITTHVLAAP